MTQTETTQPRTKARDTLEHIARREIEQALFEMPADLELPKRAIVALCIQAFIRGASWQAGIDR